MKPVIHTFHHRTCVLTISKSDLERLVQEHAFEIVNFNPIATRFEITFEDHMEGGSLPYKAGTKCVVKLIEDQEMLPKPD